LLVALLGTGSTSFVHADADDGASGNRVRVPPATVIGVTGEVSIGNGESKPTVRDAALDLEQELTTGHDGRAALRLMNVSADPDAPPLTLRVGSDTTVVRLVPDQCEPDGPPIVLRLEKGICRVSGKGNLPRLRAERGRRLLGDTSGR
jgi:hypothetical protein